jgi:hypothetical protein
MITHGFGPFAKNVQNLRANAIVEQLCKLMGDMLCCQLTLWHKHGNPIANMLSAVAYYGV